MTLKQFALQHQSQINQVTYPASKGIPFDLKKQLCDKAKQFCFCLQGKNNLTQHTIWKKIIQAHYDTIIRQR